MERKILVVDDEEVIREMLEKAFTKVGYKVCLAESAEQALEVLTPDMQVMFLDLKLPGMNGLELCRKIRSKYPMACIFAITGYASLFELSDCREAGFDDYFTKPVRLEMLFMAAQVSFEKIERWRKK